MKNKNFIQPLLLMNLANWIDGFFTMFAMHKFGIIIEANPFFRESFYTSTFFLKGFAVLGACFVLWNLHKRHGLREQIFLERITLGLLIIFNAVLIWNLIVFLFMLGWI